MTSIKFDETDRRAVIDALSKHLDVTLTPVGRRHKWLRDEAQRSYWVIGGYEDWHGIPPEMMDAEIAAPSGGMLVIAVRHLQSIQIYIGLLAPLVEARHALNRARKTTGDYQFNYTRHASHLRIDQAPNVMLSDLSGFSFDDAAKISVARRLEAEKLLKALPENELRKLLKKFHEKS